MNSQIILVAAGVACLYWGISVSTAPQSTYVQSRPSIAVRPSNLLSTKSMPSKVREMTKDPSMVRPLAAAGSEIVQVVTDPVVTGFSVAAIILSAAALFVSISKKFQQQPPAETVPLSTVQTLALASTDLEEKTNQMDAVALQTKADLERAKALTPKESILELQRGNARFWSGTPERPEMNAMQRRAQIIAQAPTVCILSCADSRVPVELVFDQGLGRIFVVRVAGNILDSTAMGSIEFAVKYLGVKVLLVMGHEACGAVKGAMTMSVDDLEKQPSYLKSVLLQIKENLNLQILQKIQDSRAQDREAIILNISSQVKKLQQNPLIAEREGNGSLLVAGAFYEITSGIVDFYTLDKNGLVVDV